MKLLKKELVLKILTVMNNKKFNEAIKNEFKTNSKDYITSNINLEEIKVYQDFMYKEGILEFFENEKKEKIKNKKNSDSEIHLLFINYNIFNNEEDLINIIKKLFKFNKNLNIYVFLSKDNTVFRNLLLSYNVKKIFTNNNLEVKEILKEIFEDEKLKNEQLLLEIEQLRNKVFNLEVQNTNNLKVINKYNKLNYFKIKYEYLRYKISKIINQIKNKKIQDNDFNKSKKSINEKVENYSIELGYKLDSDKNIIEKNNININDYKLEKISKILKEVDNIINS